MDDSFKPLSPFENFISAHPYWRAADWTGRGDEALANIYDTRTSALVGWWLGITTGFVPHVPTGLRSY